MSSTSPSASPTPSSLPAARWIALVLQFGIGVFPLSASGLVAPAWALAVIAAFWAAGLVTIWRVGRSRPVATLAVPVGTLAVWFGFLTLGERFLGWVA
ncbi:MAG: hypothetical protein WD011_05265 [Nitriliruptoraceae bacterium]